MGRIASTSDQGWLKRSNVSGSAGGQTEYGVSSQSGKLSAMASSSAGDSGTRSMGVQSAEKEGATKCLSETKLTNVTQLLNFLSHPMACPAASPCAYSRLACGAIGAPWFLPWPKVHNLHNVMRDFRRWDTAERGPVTVTYAPSPKQDGTNAAVVVWPTGAVHFQSRNRVLAPGTPDNGDFRAAMCRHVPAWARLAEPDTAVAVFGEWCGSKIGTGNAAVCRLGRRMFLIFAVVRLKPAADADMEAVRADYAAHSVINVDPAADEDLLARTGLPPDVVGVIPLRRDASFTLHLHPDRSEAEQAENMAALARANALVAEAAARDAFVADVLGVEGHGEGLVFAPLAPDGVGASYALSRYGWVGVKGVSDAFREEMAAPKPVRTDPVAEGERLRARDLAPRVCTEARLAKLAGKLAASRGEGEAGAAALTLRDTKALLDLVGADVAAEAQAEAEGAGVPMPQLVKACKAAAAAWLKTAAGASA